GVPGWPTVGLRHPLRDRSEAMMGLLDRRRARKRAADRERPAAAAAACRATLAGLREAFGPGSYYRRANTSADTWADWLEYRRSEPGGTLRGYARLLQHHKMRRWGTAAWPLMRRLVAFLRRHDG